MEKTVKQPWKTLNFLISEDVRTLPCSRDEVVVHVFCTVELLVLESRVPYPHQIVQDNVSFHDNFDSEGVMLHGSQQNLEAVSISGGT